MPLYDDLRLPLSEADASRRRILGAIGLGAIGAAAAGTVVTAVRYLEPNVLFEPNRRFVAGAPEDVPVGTVLVFAEEQIYVVRGAAGLYALSAVCTHLGCITRFEPSAAGAFACPCHGSRFARDGAVSVGPAPRPLVRVAVWLERGQIVVDPSRRVAADFVLELG